MRTRWTVTTLLLAALLAAACTSSDGDVFAVADAGATEPTAEVASTPTVAPTPAPAPTATIAAEPEPTATEPEPTVIEPAPTPAEPTADEPDSDTAAGVTNGGCGSGVEAGTTTQMFEFEGRERTFERVVPTGYDDSSPLPLVLNWHGLGSNGADQVSFSDYASLAEAQGFIVIAPTGVPAPGDTRNSWELDPDQDLTRDDLAFANELLDVAIDTLCVDQNRVYSTGMSNGGYFTSLLVCHMSDRIAAAASVAALNHPDNCDPERTVPYIAFHGTDDLVVPYAGGGESSLAPGEIIDLFLLSIADEFAEFASDAGCDAEPLVSDVSANVTSFDYQACPGDIAMTFYEISGAGHTWPGSILSLVISEAAGLGVTTAEISASETSWAFFSNYALDD